ncbi:DUF6607 family protein [Ekhidna sp.]|uniref:DUF6607 family protein n=1 Tax=Ekhidna sp. TaxID=2608089 RepID=UPI003C7B257E
MNNFYKLIICILTVFAFSHAEAQKKKKEDTNSILAMCGCYDISFNFAETFSPDKDYEFHDNYLSGGLEWVFPISKTDDKIVLQHLLIVNDTMIVKHWRQDWLYENQDLYVYDKDNNWKYKQLPKNKIKGQWTQKVFQVDDSPRYEGSATWVHYDGKHFWESMADAPLPRREFSKRSDYNVMVRKNRHEITEYGWLHEQDNLKVQRGEKDQLLAREKGWNTYTKVDKSKCQPAIDWWETNQKFWADVREAWDQVFASQKTVEINMKVDDKIMFQRLFALGKEMSGENYDAEKAKTEIKRIIEMHLASDIKLAAN